MVELIYNLYSSFSLLSDHQRLFLASFSEGALRCLTSKHERQPGPVFIIFSLVGTAHWAWSWTLSEASRNEKHLLTDLQQMFLDVGHVRSNALSPQLLRKTNRSSRVIYHMILCAPFLSIGNTVVYLLSFSDQQVNLSSCKTHGFRWPFEWTNATVPVYCNCVIIILLKCFLLCSTHTLIRERNI